MTLPHEIEDAKRAKLLDLLRRATANGTHKQVAEAILADWFPMASVDPSGRVQIKLGLGEGRDEKTGEAK